MNEKEMIAQEDRLKSTKFDPCLFTEIFGKLMREAFPEINGLPPAEPKNKYAKLIRKMSGWE